MFSLQSSVSSFIFHNFDISFTLNPAFLLHFADFSFVVWYPKPSPFCFLKQCCNVPAIFLGPNDQKFLHIGKIFYDEKRIIWLWFKFKALIFDIMYFSHLYKFYIFRIVCLTTVGKLSINFIFYQRRNSAP